MGDFWDSIVNVNEINTQFKKKKKNKKLKEKERERECHRYKEISKELVVLL